MFNPLKYLSKFIKSGNDKELEKIQRLIEQINKLENKFTNFTNEEFPKFTDQLITKLKDDDNLNKILPDAYACIREASKRVFNERHYDVQLIGGVVLNESKIAEMKTG